MRLTPAPALPKHGFPLPDLPRTTLVTTLGIPATPGPQMRALTDTWNGMHRVQTLRLIPLRRAMKHPALPPRPIPAPAAWTLPSAPASATRSGAFRHGAPGRPRGLCLIELLTGLFLGLLVMGVALGALMASRQVSSAVGDASQLQQQAAHVMRVMGRQIRQAGSLRLAGHQAQTADPHFATPVAFEAGNRDFDPAMNTIQGLDRPGRGEYKLTVGYSNYTQQLHSAATDISLQRNCLGQTHSSGLIQSRFVLDSRNHILRCLGNPAAGAQPLARNVANFQVRYLIQPSGGAARIQYVNAAAVGKDWARVTGVEVCLVLFGTEAANLPAGASYTDCADNEGNTATVDIATLPPPRSGRMHRVFRSVYQLRSHGLVR